jgi:hypothetical protein
MLASKWNYKQINPLLARPQEEKKKNNGDGDLDGDRCN